MGAYGQPRNEILENLPQDILPTSYTSDINNYENNRLASFGRLKVVVESIYERTPRQYSVLATRVELWISNRRVAVLKKDDNRVVDIDHRRIFDFEPLEMPPGYGFLTIRAYREGFISRELKWKAKTVQFGIHPGQETRLKVRLPFHVW